MKNTTKGALFRTLGHDTSNLTWLSLLVGYGSDNGKLPDMRLMQLMVPGRKGRAYYGHCLCRKSSNPCSSIVASHCIGYGTRWEIVGL